jgi:NAD+ synthase (glutamine-hydrolysing)
MKQLNNNIYQTSVTANKVRNDIIGQSLNQVAESGIQYERSRLWFLFEHHFAISVRGASNCVQGHLAQKKERRTLSIAGCKESTQGSVSMRVAIAQLNPTIGDIEGNVQQMKAALSRVPEGAAELVVFPELVVTGYPPRDLLTFDWFIDRVDAAIEQLRELSRTRPDTALLFGTPLRNGKPRGKGLSNTAILLKDGETLLEQRKRLLPTYDVFDEQRYFDRGDDEHWKTVELAGERIGVSICEDAWNDETFEDRVIYDHNPIESLAKQGTSLMVNITASPFNIGKNRRRFERYANHARRWKCPVIVCAQVGANDELLFDGSSMLIDSRGNLVEMLAPFKEDLSILDTLMDGKPDGYLGIGEMEALWNALVMGVRDYMRKTGFHEVVLGLSGGIDSALVACIAAKAIGPENVRTVTMPSMFSSAGSVEDSLQLAKNLGIRCDTLEIRDLFDAGVKTLEPVFKGRESDVAEENLQARIRGTLLMAYSNKFGSLLLSTGNKSELAMGYCTLYGDMDGGLAVISDLTKTQVYQLARWYNQDEEVIPAAILTKAPSAELKPNQTDQDTLPPYEKLDPILVAYLEEGKGIDDIVAEGNDRETVEWVIRTVDRNEYKRWQAAPGLRVSPKAFGAGRRMPIAAKKY